MLGAQSHHSGRFHLCKWITLAKACRSHHCKAVMFEKFSHDFGHVLQLS